MTFLTPHRIKVIIFYLAIILVLFSTSHIYGQKRETVINIKNLGALGDGIHDDTKVIQDAFNTYDSIDFPNGKYLITESLQINRSIKMNGAGFILKADSLNKPSVKIQSSNINISGLRIDGNRANQTTFNYHNDEISLRTINHCTIAHSFIKNSAGTGIAAYSCSDLVITFDTVVNSYDNGIFVGNGNSNNNTVSNNFIDSTSKRNGIFITASPASQKTTNYIKDNKILKNIVKHAGDTNIESGIHTQNTIIADNYCEGGSNASILVRDATNIKITGNTIICDTTGKTKKGDGIAFLPQYENNIQTNSDVSNNTIKYSSRYSIYVSNMNGITITDNSIVGTRPQTNGIYLTGDSLFVHNNTISNVRFGVGIQLYEKVKRQLKHLEIHDNKISNFETGIINRKNDIIDLSIKGNELTDGVTGIMESDSNPNSSLSSNKFTNLKNKVFNQ